MSAPQEASFVYFGNIPDRQVHDGYSRSGNIVAVPPGQLSSFMETAAPHTLEAWYGLHSPVTIHRLGELASAYALSGKAIEVTGPICELVVATQLLVEGLPDDFKRDFPVDDDQSPTLRLQKTSDGDLLMGVLQNTQGSPDGDGTPMLHALIGADGFLKDYSSVYAYSFDPDGRQIDSVKAAYIKGKARHAYGLGFWADYLPTVTRLIEAHQAGDEVSVQQKTQDLWHTIKDRSADATPFGDLSVPDFLQTLTEGQREDLLYGQLPENFIPPSVPHENILEGMRFSNIEHMLAALEQWNIPYTEVSYTADVRRINAANLTAPMADGHIPGTFDHAYSILPETFSWSGSRNHHDIYARIRVNGSDGIATEKEILLYDGSAYEPGIDGYQAERIPMLTIPQEVRDYLAQSDAQPVVRHTVTRPTTQIIRSDAITARYKENLIQCERFVLDQPPAQHSEVCVVLDSQSLPLTPEMIARLNRHEVVGHGPYVHHRQELTISYNRLGDVLVASVDDARSVTKYEEPKTYKNE